MVSIFKWRIFWYFFYIPVLQCFAFGQVDLFLLPALFIRNSVSMALLTLKPQLIWLYLPFWFWQASKRERVLFILTVAVLWSLSFLIWPAWILHFNTRPIPVAVYASPSLFGGEVLPWWTGIIVGVTLIILSRDKLAATTAVNPFIQMYDLILLLPGAKWWIVPLSWLCWGLYYWSGLIFPYVLLPILTIIVPQYIIKQFNSINATWEVDYDRQSPPI